MQLQIQQHFQFLRVNLYQKLLKLKHHQTRTISQQLDSDSMPCSDLHSEIHNGYLQRIDRKYSFFLLFLFLSLLFRHHFYCHYYHPYSFLRKNSKFLQGKASYLVLLQENRFTYLVSCCQTLNYSNVKIFLSEL